MGTRAASFLLRFRALNSSTLNLQWRRVGVHVRVEFLPQSTDYSKATRAKPFSDSPATPPTPHGPIQLLPVLGLGVWRGAEIAEAEPPPEHLIAGQGAARRTGERQSRLEDDLLAGPFFHEQHTTIATTHAPTTHWQAELTS